MASASNSSMATTRPVNATPISTPPQNGVSNQGGKNIGGKLSNSQENQNQNLPFSPSISGQSQGTINGKIGNNKTVGGIKIVGGNYDINKIPSTKTLVKPNKPQPSVSFDEHGKMIIDNSQNVKTQINLLNNSSNNSNTIGTMNDLGPNSTSGSKSIPAAASIPVGSSGSKSIPAAASIPVGSTGPKDIPAAASIDVPNTSGGINGIGGLRKDDNDKIDEKLREKERIAAEIKKQQENNNLTGNYNNMNTVKTTTNVPTSDNARLDAEQKGREYDAWKKEQSTKTAQNNGFTDLNKEDIDFANLKYTSKDAKDNTGKNIVGVHSQWFGDDGHKLYYNENDKGIYEENDGNMILMAYANESAVGKGKQSSSSNSGNSNTGNSGGTLPETNNVSHPKNNENNIPKEAWQIAQNNTSSASVKVQAEAQGNAAAQRNFERSEAQRQANNNSYSGNYREDHPDLSNSNGGLLTSNNSSNINNMPAMANFEQPTDPKNIAALSDLNPTTEPKDIPALKEINPTNVPTQNSEPQMTYDKNLVQGTNAPTNSYSIGDLRKDDNAKKKKMTEQRRIDQAIKQQQANNNLIGDYRNTSTTVQNTSTPVASVSDSVSNLGAMTNFETSKGPKDIMGLYNIDVPNNNQDYAQK